MSETYGTIVYCVAQARSLSSDTSLEAKGLGGGGVRLLPYRDLVAIVGDAQQEGHYQVSRRNVRAHEQVIEEVMRHGDVLPLRFGEVAPTDDEVIQTLLEPKYDELLKRLERVHDCVELGLKVSFDEATLFDEIRSMHEEIVNAGGRAASIDERISVGQEVAQVIESKRDREAERILDELSPLATEVVRNEPTTDLMILNAAFLVARSRVEEFDERVQKIGERESGRMTFTYVGPLAPYNFVDLRIGAEEAATEETEAQRAE